MAMDSQGNILAAQGDRIIKSRIASSNNYLSSLSLAGYSLNQVFDKDVIDYSVVVDGSVTSVDITAVKEDAKAIIRNSDGSTYTSGETKTVAIGLGDNPITFEITADNGDKRTYTLTVKSPIPPDRILIRILEGGYYYGGAGDSSLYVGDSADSALKFDLNSVNSTVIEASLNVRTHKDYGNITKSDPFV